MSATLLVLVAVAVVIPFLPPWDYVSEKLTGRLLPGQPCTFEEQPLKRPRRIAPSGTQDGAISYGDTANNSPVEAVPVPAPARPLSLHNPPTYTPTSLASLELPSEIPQMEDGPTLNLYHDATVEHVGPSADPGPDYLSRVEVNDSPRQSTSGRQDNSSAVETTRLPLDRRKTIMQDEGEDPVHFKVIQTGELRQTSSSRAPFPDYDTHVDLPTVLRQIRTSAIQLVDLYIRVVHPSFPIINPVRVVRWLGPALRSNHEINHRDLAVFPLVASQMLVAYHWRNFTPTTLPEMDLTSLHAYLKQSIALELERPRLVTVQSLLLKYSILASTTETKNMFRVWTGMGTLVTTAQNLGLHRSPERWNIAEWEMQLR